MQKYEYLYVDAFMNDLSEVNGKPVHGSKDSLPGYINEIGDKGWELVNSFLLNGDNLIKLRWRLLFKRDKQ
jgi:hypothetical protein